MADALKAEGNKAFAAKDYDLAIDLFSKALDLDQKNFVLWSNRSAAKAGKRDWDGALADADEVCLCPTFWGMPSICELKYPSYLFFRGAFAFLQCIKVNPTWAKGYARKGAALHGQRRYVEAIETYEAGLKLEDNPVLRKGYEEVKAAKGNVFMLFLKDSLPRSTGVAYLQLRTSAAMAQMRWASASCSATQTCSPSSPRTRVRRSYSPMPVSCKRYDIRSPAVSYPVLTALPFAAQTHTAKPAARAEPAQWRPAHDRRSRRTHAN